MKNKYNKYNYGGGFQKASGILGALAPMAGLIPGVGAVGTAALGIGSAIFGQIDKRKVEEELLKKRRESALAGYTNNNNVAMGYFRNGGIIDRMIKGGQINCQYGGDIKLSDNSFQVQGNPSEIDGERRTIVGTPVRLSHNELVEVDNKDEAYAYSSDKKFKHPLSPKETFADVMKPVLKAKGKLEEKDKKFPGDIHTQNALKHLKTVTDSNRNIQELMRDLKSGKTPMTAEQSAQGYARGGNILPNNYPYNMQMFPYNIVGNERGDHGLPEENTRGTAYNEFDDTKSAYWDLNKRTSTPTQPLRQNPPLYVSDTTSQIGLYGLNNYSEQDQFDRTMNGQNSSGTIVPNTPATSPTPATGGLVDPTQYHLNMIAQRRGLALNAVKGTNITQPLSAIPGPLATEVIASPLAEYTKGSSTPGDGRVSLEEGLAPINPNTLRTPGDDESINLVSGLNTSRSSSPDTPEGNKRLPNTTGDWVTAVGSGLGVLMQALNVQQPEFVQAYQDRTPVTRAIYRSEPMLSRNARTMAAQVAGTSTGSANVDRSMRQAYYAQKRQSDAEVLSGVAEANAKELSNFYGNIAGRERYNIEGMKYANEINAQELGKYSTLKDTVIQSMVNTSQTVGNMMNANVYNNITQEVLNNLSAQYGIDPEVLAQILQQASTSNRSLYTNKKSNG